MGRRARLVVVVFAVLLCAVVQTAIGHASAASHTSGSHRSVAGTPTFTGGAAAERWSAPTAALFGNAPIVPGALACTTGDFCLAVDGFGATLVYRDGSWSKSPAVMPNTPKNVHDSRTPEPGIVDCADASLCVDGGNDGAIWLWNGTTWRYAPAGHNAGAVVVSCPRRTARPICFLAIGNTFARYDGGAGWSKLGSIERGPGHNVNLSLSCPSASFCAVADGDSARAYTWDGHRWSAAVSISGLPKLSVVDISCPVTGQCLLLDGFTSSSTDAVWRYVNGGWSTPINALTGSTLAGDGSYDLDCVSSFYCLAVGLSTTGASSGLYAIDLGSSPRSVHVGSAPADTAGGPLAVSCGSVCAVSSGGGSFSQVPVNGPHITSISPSFGSVGAASAYTSLGLHAPPAIRLTGADLENVGQVLFAGVPAQSVIYRSDRLLLVQPPPGRAGVADVALTWLVGTNPAPAAADYTYEPYSTLRLQLAGRPSATGRTGAPALISADLEVGNQPIGAARLTWRRAGRIMGSATVGPLAPGRYRLRVYSGQATRSALGGAIEVCVQVNAPSVDSTKNACADGTVSISSPPFTSKPWWVWVIVGLVAGIAGSLTAGVQLRRRRVTQPAR